MSSAHGCPLSNSPPVHPRSSNLCKGKCCAVFFFVYFFLFVYLFVWYLEENIAASSYPRCRKQSSRPNFMLLAEQPKSQWKQSRWEIPIKICLLDNVAFSSLGFKGCCFWLCLYITPVLTGKVLVTGDMGLTAAHATSRQGWEFEL